MVDTPGVELDDGILAGLVGDLGTSRKCGGDGVLIMVSSCSKGRDKLLETYVIDEARSEKAEVDILVEGIASVGRVFVASHCVCGDFEALVYVASNGDDGCARALLKKLTDLSDR